MSDQIIINTDRINMYSQKASWLARRLNEVYFRIKDLYKDAGVYDLNEIIKHDTLNKCMRDLDACSDYMSKCSYIMWDNENKIQNKMGDI